MVNKTEKVYRGRIPTIPKISYPWTGKVPPAKKAIIDVIRMLVYDQPLLRAIL